MLSDTCLNSLSKEVNTAPVVCQYHSLSSKNVQRSFAILERKLTDGRSRVKSNNPSTQVKKVAIQCANCLLRTLMVFEQGLIVAVSFE